MKTAGIVIDDWKLAIFKRHLDKAALSYTETSPGLTIGTTLLRVACNWASEVAPVVEAAERECQQEKRRRP